MQVGVKSYANICSVESVLSQCNAKYYVPEILSHNDSTIMISYYKFLKIMPATIFSNSYHMNILHSWHLIVFVFVVVC